MFKSTTNPSKAARRFARKLAISAAVLGTGATALLGLGVGTAGAVINQSSCTFGSLQFNHTAGEGYYYTLNAWCGSSVSAINVGVKVNGNPAEQQQLRPSLGSFSTSSLTKFGYFTPVKGASYQLVAVVYNSAGSETGFATSGSPQVLNS
jgi:hypothetical protein